MSSPDDTIDSGRKRWHIGKEIPISAIVFLLAQTAAIVWWASSVGSKLERTIEQQALMADQQLKMQIAVAGIKVKIEELGRRESEIERSIYEHYREDQAWFRNRK